MRTRTKWEPVIIALCMLLALLGTVTDTQAAAVSLNKTSITL